MLLENLEVQFLERFFRWQLCRSVGGLESMYNRIPVIFFYMLVVNAVLCPRIYKIQVFCFTIKKIKKRHAGCDKNGFGIRIKRMSLLRFWEHLVGAVFCWAYLFPPTVERDVKHLRHYHYFLLKWSRSWSSTRILTWSVLEIPVVQCQSLRISVVEKITGSRLHMVPNSFQHAADGMLRFRSEIIRIRWLSCQVCPRSPCHEML